MASPDPPMNKGKYTSQISTSFPTEVCDWVPRWPYFEVLPLVSVGCARIPILALSINAPHQRSDTLMQLSRSPAQRSALRRTAGPYNRAADFRIAPQLSHGTADEDCTSFKRAPDPFETFC
jgi:hypothetical protein